MVVLTQALTKISASVMQVKVAEDFGLNIGRQAVFKQLKACGLIQASPTIAQAQNPSASCETEATVDGTEEHPTTESETTGKGSQKACQKTRAQKAQATCSERLKSQAKEAHITAINANRS